jgi:poly(hydroxyalkanoate) depolymerase family esterase
LLRSIDDDRFAQLRPQNPGIAFAGHHRARMVKRFRALSWGKSLQRTVAKLTRSAVRSGTKALVKAAKPAAKAAARRVAERTPSEHKRAPPGDGDWTLGIATIGSASRRFRLYRPPGLRPGARAPLMVMLHGCTQNASGFAVSTRMNRVAAREGFLVLYPEQERLANPQACWNWYETRSGRAQVEAAVILAAVDQAVLLHGADVQRVAVAGLSAGASMAAFLAAQHPLRFKAVAMHSGIGPGAAHSTATAMSAMQGLRPPSLGAAGDAGVFELPPLLVIHGTLDAVVRVRNGRDVAATWAAALGAKPAAVRTVKRGQRHPMDVTDYKRLGRVQVTFCEMAGLAHAWSGGAVGQPYSDPEGPDASRMIWAFAARRF